MESTKQGSNEPKKHVSLAVARPLQNMDIVNTVIVVLYRYRAPVMYKDIAVACKIHPVNVSQALSAARDIGLTELSGKKGLYTLTKDGEQYAMLITAGKCNEAKDILRNTIKKNPLWAEIIRFLNATRGQSRDPLDLILEIERITGKHWSSTTRFRLRDSLVSILESAAMVIKEGSKIIPIDNSVFEHDEGYGEETSIEVRPMTQESQLSRKSSFELEQNFAVLRGDEFTFEVRKDLDSIEFAKKQFSDWIEHVRKKIEREKQENRQSGGVQNQ
jgi:hypothetical protein